MTYYGLALSVRLSTFLYAPELSNRLRYLHEILKEYVRGQDDDKNGCSPFLSFQVMSLRLFFFQTFLYAP